MKKLIIAFLSLISVAAHAQDTLRLKVMTYNLRFGELASLEELAAHIKSFKPDFVAVQECDYMTGRDRAPKQNGKDFITELAYHTGMMPLYGKTINYSGGLYGIGILSKHPYFNVVKTMLPNPDSKREPRALLNGMFEVNGKDTLVFACTHLDYFAGTTREKQVEAINEILYKSKYPVIVGGDFNAAPDSKEIQKGMSAWFPFTNSDLTIPAWNPTVKIDYLFGYPKNGWRLIRTQTVQSLLSDHLPIISEIEYIKKK